MSDYFNNIFVLNYSYKNRVFVVLPDISQIKRKRLALGMSQASLAKSTGVSQSLIAKIEAGKLVPSYGNAKKIFDFFDSMRPQAGLTAKDIMSRKVKSTTPFDNVKGAVLSMKRNGISQLPVLVDGRPVGTISERLLVDKMQHEKNLEEIGSKKVEEIMDDTLPTVTEEASIDTISALLESSQAILVTKKGIVVGVISRPDLFGPMLKKR